jgi:apolipoprotein N-acyltransferase
VRSWLFTGFPWLFLGYSQVTSPLAGYIPILGNYGLGYLLLVLSAWLVYIYQDYHSLRRWLGGLLFIAVVMGGGLLLQKISWSQAQGKTYKVSLVQGNIPQQVKWLSGHVPETLRIYAKATQKHWSSDVIIWPEGAIPLPKHWAEPFLKQLDQRAKQHHSAVLLGIPVAQQANSFYFYNALITLGQGQGHYYKNHLVPFGEYIPFGGFMRGLVGLFNIPMSNMVSGRLEQKNLQVQGVALAPFICYEIAYANDLRAKLPQARWLVTVTDDAWFGDSLAPAQHLQIAQFRAIQAARPLLFNGNNGITALINSQGQIRRRLPQFKRAVLTVQLQPRVGETPWVWYGNGPILTLVALLGIVALILECLL